MRHRTGWLLGIALLSVSPALAQTPSAPLAEHLPADTLLYAAWAGKTLTFSGSMMGQLLDEPFARDVVAALETAAQAQLPEGPSRELFGQGWSMARLLWRHPLAVAVLDPGDLGERPALPPMILLLRLEDDREAFEKHWEALLAALAESQGLPFEPHIADNARYHTLTVDEGVTLAVGTFTPKQGGPLFFVTLGPADTPQRLFATTAEESLGRAAGFTGALQPVSGDNVQIAVYAHVQRAVEILRPLADAALRQGSPQAPDLQAVLQAAGMDKATTYAGTVRIVDRGMYSRFRLQTPAPHRGLLLLYAGAPILDSDLEGVPDDTLFAQAANVSPLAVYEETRRALRALDPNTDRQLQGMLQGISEELGVSVTDDLLAHLGDTWVLASAPSLGGLLTGTVLSVELTNEEAFRTALDKVLARFQETATATAPGDPRPPASRFRVRTVRTPRGRVQYLAPVGESLLPIAPAWAIHRKRLYVGLYPQVVQTAIAEPPAPPLTGTPRFQKLRAYLTGKPALLSYTDTPQVARHAYPLALVGWTTLANAAGNQAGTPLLPEWLPALSTLEKYLIGHVEGISADAEGILFEGYGSLPLNPAGLLFNLVSSPLSAMGALFESRPQQPYQYVPAPTESLIEG